METYWDLSWTFNEHGDNNWRNWNIIKLFKKPYKPLKYWLRGQYQWATSVVLAKRRISNYKGYMIYLLKVQEQWATSEDNDKGFIYEEH